MKKLLGLLVFLCLVLPQSLLAEPLSLSEGSYEVEVSLWHAYEDKLSMGSDGIDKKAELFIKDGEAWLYLSLKPITAFSLTSSVGRFYILDETKRVYESGVPKAFDLKLSPEAKERPSLMLLPLREKAELYSVLVDPGISLMGKDPIKARLHINWDSLKPLSEMGELKKKASLPEAMSEAEVLDYSLDGVTLFSAPKFNEFKVSPVSRQDLVEKGLKIGGLDKIKGYDLSLLAPVAIIPEDKTTNVSALAEPVIFEQKVRLCFNEQGFDQVLVLKEGGFEPLEAKKTASGLEVEVNQLGIFALLKEGQAPLAKALPVRETPLAKNVPIVKKPVAKKPLKVKKVDRKTLQEKAKALKASSEVSPQDEKTLPSEPKPRERYGIIGLILGFYGFLGLVGLWLLKKSYPSLMAEWERRQYIRYEALKGGTKK